jgi:uridine kinase
MNERIKELAEQARNHALDEKRIYERMHNTEQCMEEYREVYNKRFAELIVRECMECADIVGKSNLTSGYPNSTAHHIKQKIREHFGVEE